MNSSVRSRPPIKVSLRQFRLALLVFIMPVVVPSVVFSQNSPSQHQIPPSLTAHESVPPAIAAPLALPSCPSAARPPIISSQPEAGHHKVLLSWNPSVPSNDEDRIAVGYCVYRRKEHKREKGSQKLDPDCNDCEKINLLPIVGTRCLDDVVDDNAIYYYVVTAINKKGTPSQPSKGTTAVIPAGKQTVYATSPSSPPSCRGTSEIKNAAAN